MVGVIINFCLKIDSHDESLHIFLFFVIRECFSSYRKYRDFFFFLVCFFSKKAVFHMTKKYLTENHVNSSDHMSEPDGNNETVSGNEPETEDLNLDEIDDSDTPVIKGLHHYKHGRFREALSHFNEALEDDPDNPNILFNIAMCMMRGELYETHMDLMAVFERIIDIDDRYKDAWANKGTYLAACGNLIDALSCLDKAIEIEDDPHVFENRGNVFLEIGNFRKALEDFNMCLELGSEARPELIYKKGIALLELRQFEESLECFENVLGKGYNTLEAGLSKAEILLDLGRIPEAIDDCDRILEDDPDNLRARGLKGISLHFSGKDDLAKKELERAKIIANDKGMQGTELLNILEKTINVIDD